MVMLYKQKFTLSKASYNQVKSSFLNSLSESNYSIDSKALILFEEIVLNILVHAKSCSGTFLSIQVEQKSKELVFLFIDDANYFDLRSHTSSFQSVGGWGIVFIKKLAKKIYYKRFKSKNYLLIGFS